MGELVATVSGESGVPESEGVAFRRADAKLNYERVFATALAVFAEHGLQATVPQVAERAGVGKATVYRSYPSKEDLVEAVVRRSVHALEQSLDTEVHTDPFAEFRRQIFVLLHTLRRDRLLAEALAERQTTQTTILNRYTALMEAAKVTGSVRSDACMDDLRIMLCGPVLLLMKSPHKDPARWDRLGELFLQAIRPPQ
ncbi:TetR/AcrR family transcriptional regulator [Streptomyces sp. NPDC059215]|uniref:TetR/AcrR family transcriptional regulator n=1 Tax=Streptomyces sp. NPDC059215 TaxID=3346772 RepID=UPI0036B2969B